MLVGRAGGERSPEARLPVSLELAPDPPRAPDVLPAQDLRPLAASLREPDAADVHRAQARGKRRRPPGFGGAPRIRVRAHDPAVLLRRK